MSESQHVAPPSFEVAHRVSRFTPRARVIRWDLAELFARLRDEGIFAREEYECCQSCGFAAASGEISPERHFGVVFYHEQDAIYAFGPEEREADSPLVKPLYLSYDAVSVDGDAVAIGRIVEKVAACIGLPFQWSGARAHRLMILPYHGWVS